jgi:hypothetical protein
MSDFDTTQGPVALCAAPLFALVCCGIGFFIGVWIGGRKYLSVERSSELELVVGIQSLVILWFVVKLGVLPSFAPTTPLPHKESWNHGDAQTRLQMSGWQVDVPIAERRETSLGAEAHQETLHQRQRQSHHRDYLTENSSIRHDTEWKQQCEGPCGLGSKGATLKRFPVMSHKALFPSVGVQSRFRIRQPREQLAVSGALAGDFTKSVCQKGKEPARALSRTLPRLLNSTSHLRQYASDAIYHRTCDNRSSDTGGFRRLSWWGGMCSVSWANVSDQATASARRC